MSSEGETSSKREKEDEDENVISMLDVLAEEKQLEEDANAVLGGGDDKNCTYPGGYVKRQPLYSCTTCITTNDSPAGVCLACSYDCHEGHSLVELYTKRNFRCDCGNSKFQRNACKLYATKELENTQNTYNQNFRGVYCTCSRPYPDPEDDVDDDMLQCTICEDWFHSRHLGTPRASDDYDEMVCDQCMAKHTFLQAYAVHSDVVKITPEETPATSQIDVLSDHTTDDDKQPVNGSVKSENKERTDDGLSSTDAAKHNSSENMNGTTSDACNNKSTDVTDASCSVSSESASDHCLLVDLSTREATPAVTATYWSNGWRSKLCTCSACQTMYIDQGIGFLIDETDTVHVYEEQAKVKQKATDFERGMDALGSMDRVQLGEIMHGYNNLKEELTNYLKKFAENGKVVREEDIREFFEQMQARKRQKTGEGSMQYFCR